MRCLGDLESLDTSQHGIVLGPAVYYRMAFVLETQNLRTWLNRDVHNATLDSRTGLRMPQDAFGGRERKSL